MVVAHYHPEGLLRDDLQALLARLAPLAQRLIFVSTHLRADQLARLPAGVTPLVRENVGYDFYSYRTGLQALGELRAYSRLVLCNSSFITVEPDKLLRGFFEREHAQDCFGLVYSREHRRHLSSFLLSFTPCCFTAPLFAGWWERMVPINDRAQVIPRYELGLSSALRHAGFRLGRAYRPTLGEQWVALRRALPTAKRTLSPLALNPMLFYWDFVLREFGVAKIELVRADPYGLLDQPTRERLRQICGAAGAA